MLAGYGLLLRAVHLQASTLPPCPCGTSMWCGLLAGQRFRSTSPGHSLVLQASNRPPNRLRIHRWQARKCRVTPVMHARRGRHEREGGIKGAVCENSQEQAEIAHAGHLEVHPERRLEAFSH